MCDVHPHRHFVPPPPNAGATSWAFSGAVPAFGGGREGVARLRILRPQDVADDLDAVEGDQVGAIRIVPPSLCTCRYGSGGDGGRG